VSVTSFSTPIGQCVLDFHALARTDLARVHRWLNEPSVSRWYSRHPFSEREVVVKYAPRIEGREQVRVFVARVDGQAVGLMQTYRLSDFPRYAALIDAAPGWAGIDFLIGEPEYRGHGLGARFVDLFIREKVFASVETDACIAGPSPGNVASIRALERARFKFFRTLKNAGETEHLMIRRSRD